MLTSSDIKYMKMAERLALLSDCTKRKVGAVGVGPIFHKTGFNLHRQLCDCKPYSKTVIHAERFVLHKSITRIYCTYQPCLECAKAIIRQSSCLVLFYRDEKPSDLRGIEFLKMNGVEVRNEWAK